MFEMYLFSSLLLTSNGTLNRVRLYYLEDKFTLTNSFVCLRRDPQFHLLGNNFRRLSDQIRHVLFARSKKVQTSVYIHTRSNSSKTTTVHLGDLELGTNRPRGKSSDRDQLLAASILQLNTPHWLMFLSLAENTDGEVKALRSGYVCPVCNNGHRSCPESASVRARDRIYTIHHYGSPIVVILYGVLLDRVGTGTHTYRIDQWQLS